MGAVYPQSQFPGLYQPLNFVTPGAPSSSGNASLGFAIGIGNGVYTTTITVGEGGFYAPVGAGDTSTSFLAVVPFAPVGQGGTESFSFSNAILGVSDWVSLISANYIYGGNGGYGPVGGQTKIVVNGVTCSAWGMTWVGVTPITYPFPSSISDTSGKGGRCTFQVVLISNPLVVGGFTLQLNYDDISWTAPTWQAALEFAAIYNIWGPAADQQYAFAIPGSYFNGPNGAPPNPEGYANALSDGSITALSEATYQSEGVLGRLNFFFPQWTENLGTSFPGLLPPITNPTSTTGPGSGYPFTEPSGSLTGVCTASDVDLTGVIVELYTLQNSVTPSNGLYDITPVVVGNYDAIAVDNGYTPILNNVDIFPAQATTSNFEFTASAASYLTGWTLDPVTGIPVPGATVTASSTGQTTVSTTSGAGGGWILALPGIAATWTVCVSLTGLTTNCTQMVTNPGQTTGPGIITLTPPSNAYGAASAFGYVTDYERGDVLPGAIVATSNLTGYTSTASETGLYDIEALPSQTSITLRATYSGYRPTFCTFLSPAASSILENIGLISTATNVGSVSGFVTDESSNALAGVSVIIQGLTQTVTSATGYYSITGVPVTSSISVQFVLTGYIPLQETCAIASGVTTTLNAELLVLNTNEIVVYGRVVNALTGVPIPSATVATSLVTTTSAMDGSYVLTGIAYPPDFFSITGSRTGYYPNTIPNIPSYADLLLQLTVGLVSTSTPTGTVQGFAFVSQSTNSRIPGALISLGPYLQTVTSSPQGAYAFLTAPSGIPWTGTALASGYLPCVMNDLEVAEGSDLEVDFPMTAFVTWVSVGSLSVTVLDAVSGLPLTGATVAVANANVANGVTNTSGVATFTNIPAGDTGVLASSAGHIPIATFAAINLVSPANITISLYPFPAWMTGAVIWGKVSSIVIDAGNSVADALVYTDPAFLGYAVTTSQYGLYIILNAPPGSGYSITCDNPDYQLASVSGITLTALEILEQDFVLTPWSGELPLGWRTLQLDTVSVVGQTEYVCATLDMTTAQIETLQPNVTALAVQDDTIAYARYRRMNLGVLTPIPYPNDIITYAVWLGPTAQVFGPSFLAQPVNTNPALVPPGQTIPIPPAPIPITTNSTAYSDTLLGAVNGENRVFTFTYAPNNNVASIFTDGVIVDPSQYTISGTVLTLNFAPTAGEVLAIYTYSS